MVVYPLNKKIAPRGSIQGDRSKEKGEKAVSNSIFLIPNSQVSNPNYSQIKTDCNGF